MSANVEHITISDIDFAIVNKNERDASIVVCYWAKGYTHQVQYNLTLPIDHVAGTIPTGEELVAFIMSHAPVDWLNTEIARYKTSVVIDYAEIDQMILSAAERIPKQF